MITSFRHDKARLRRRRQLLATGLVLVLIVFVLRGPVSGLLGEVLFVVGKPIWATENGIVSFFENVSTLFTSKTTLQEENDRLQKLIKRMAIESYTYDALKEENVQLKNKLGRAGENDLLLARILVGPPVSPYDTFLVDVGMSHGIVEGMRVFTDGDFVLGEVTRVQNGSAIVALYSSPGTELSATLGKKSIPITLHGRGGGSFGATIPKNEEVAVGDLIEVPALSRGYVGVVKEITQTDSSSLALIHIEFPVNIHELKWLYIEKFFSGHSVIRENE